jgi:hypothetical protein
MSELEVSKRALRLLKAWLAMENRSGKCPFYRKKGETPIDERVLFGDRPRDDNDNYLMCRRYCREAFPVLCASASDLVRCPCRHGQETYIVRRVRAYIKQKGAQ